MTAALCFSIAFDLKYLPLLALPIIALELAQIFLAAKASLPACDLDLELLDDPDSENEMLVELHIYQNTQQSGGDRGVLCFDDNGLIFAGHRSSFSISWEDLELGNLAAYGSEPAGPSGHRLRLKHSEVRIILSFFPLSTPGEGSGKAGDRLTRILREFTQSRKKTPQGRHYPPLAFDSSGSQLPRPQPETS